MHQSDCGDIVRPLCIELFCGKFGWSEGWLEMGGQAIGFDIEHCDYHGPVPDGAELVLQDVKTLHGSQFKNASLIFASPPCTEYSYMAMPWSRSKQIQRALLGQDEFPANYNGGSRTISELNTLFDACFRIQREASEAAGHHIPMVVENVRGAQSWVGRAKWAYGSFYLWGDVPAIMPTAKMLARDGVKHKPSDPEATGWFGKFTPNGTDLMRNTSSESPARKAASAQIAKIPYELSRWIAKVYKP